MAATVSKIPDAARLSSPLKINEALSRVREKRLPNGAWLRKGNHYANETIKKLEKADGNNAPTKPNELAEYIAVSSVLHCSDGWLFFSNAVEDLLNGDTSTAIFMAYYAQLRAMMSFFAAEGIGVFNKKHFWFDSAGKPFSVINTNTHKFVRELVIAWAQEPSNGSKLLSTLTFETKSFSEWAREAQFLKGSPLFTILASDWLRTWSIDLSTLTDDHNVRNEVSYRPQKLFSHGTNPDLEQSLQVLIDLWKASEPYGSNRFSILDLYLLRKTLSFLYYGRTGNNPRASQRYRFFVEKIMENLGVTPRNEIVNFLIFKNNTNEHPVFDYAKNPGVNADGSFNALPILSRAFILLRLASASTENLLRASSIGRDDILFWWNAFGIEFGYWLPGDAPEQLSDLWEDIQDSLNPIETWLNGNVQINSFSLHQNFPHDIKKFAQFNRACFWSLGL